MESPDNQDRDEPDFETREEWEAAAEAAAIGGRQPPSSWLDPEEDDDDEALRPVIEAGGGEGEGFELAERDLVRNASHEDGQAFPEEDAFSPEHESDRATTDYAQADEEIHSDD
jgi:hypothetical protein